MRPTTPTWTLIRFFWKKIKRFIYFKIRSSSLPKKRCLSLGPRSPPYLTILLRTMKMKRRAYKYPIGCGTSLPRLKATRRRFS